MKRRGFMQALLSMSGMASLGIRPTFGRVAPRQLIQQSPLAGFQYHEGENLWPRLAIGDALQLIREPFNPYDSQAVRIDWRGQKLGYVARRDNTAVSQMLDRKVRLTANIAGCSMPPTHGSELVYKLGWRYSNATITQRASYCNTGDTNR